MRKLLTYLIYVLIASLFCAYMINDGFYVLSNIGTSQRQWIDKYSVVKFPKGTVIEKFKIGSEDNSYFFRHNQYLEAVVLVPNGEVEPLFEKGFFIYDDYKEPHFDLRENRKDKEQTFWFSAYTGVMVSKWFTKIESGHLFTVEKPGEKYTRVYMVISYLGWNKCEQYY